MTIADAIAQAEREGFQVEWTGKLVKIVHRGNDLARADFWNTYFSDRTNECSTFFEGPADDRQIFSQPIVAAKAKQLKLKPADVSVYKLSMVPPEFVASDFLSDFRYGAVLTLRHWQSSFWVWNAGRYIELKDQDIEAMLVESLRGQYAFVKKSDVANAMMNIKSQCNIPSTAQPPTWIEALSMVPSSWQMRDLFCSRNEIIHLPSLVARLSPYSIPTTPAFFNTAATDYDFNIGAPPPVRWLRFLNEVLGDPDSIELLRQWFGYLLTTNTSHQKIALMIGGKRSGKGTTARVITSVIGRDNVCGPQLSSFATNFGLSELIGKSVAIIGDARLSHRTDPAVITERLLAISGEDLVSVDRKYRDPVSVRLRTRLTILSNEIPRLIDTSGALAGRMIVIRFPNSFYHREDLTLEATLESERDGILLWAIGGWASLRSNGHFITPVNSLDLIEQLEDIGSPVAQFVREECILDDASIAELNELYEHYRAWCTANGKTHILEKEIFSRDLTAAFPTLCRQRSRIGGSRHTIIRGIRPKPSA